jgi:predicted ABC-type exoprotein transport system permease subunit
MSKNKSTLISSLATGLFIVIFLALALSAYANLVGAFGPNGFSITSLIIFIVLAVILGWIWIARKKILPKSVQV